MEIQFACSDCIVLGGTFYAASEAKAAVLLAPATGIKKSFYHSFASFLSENGYSVLTFDNRGIGTSSGTDINKVNASIINWGRLDMTAALLELQDRVPNTSYHLIGHSAGGQLVGLMDNAHDLKSLFNFAASSGHLKNMPYPFRISATFFLNYFISVSNFFFGRCNSQWVGMGEPLPKKVGKQWSKYCNGPGYVRNDFGEDIKSHYYDELTLPSKWLYASDDGIASEKNVKEMAAVYSASKAEFLELDPQKLGVPDLGHIKFFSKKKKELWVHALD